MKKIIVFDTETTGLSSVNDEILQLSIIDGEKNILLNNYYKPSHTDSWDDAYSVNKISKEMVADKPFITEDIDKIQQIFDDADILIGYNIDFDISFLKEIGIQFKENIEHYDVMKVFAEIYGVWNTEKQGYKWQKLTLCAYYYNFDWTKYPAHNSLGDCFATLHCYEKIEAGKRHRLDS